MDIISILPYVGISIGLVVVFLFLLFRDKFSSPLSIGLKTLASLLFVLTAVFSLLKVSKTETYNVNNNVCYGLIIFGLVCGLIGDILLDLRVYFKGLFKKQEIITDKSSTFTTYGISSFLLGHISYIAALCFLYPDKLLFLLLSFIIGAAIMVTSQLLSLKVLKFNYEGHFPISTIYGIILATFLVYFIFLFCTTGFNVGLLLLLIAAILFSGSDYLLSIMYFSPTHKYELPGRKNPECRMNIVINHATYYIAQFLIALSIMFII